MKLSKLVAPVLLIALSACSTAGKNSESQSVEAEGGKVTEKIPPTALSRADAAIRSHQVAHVSYVLWFGLDGNHEDYEGRTVINFELKSKAKEHGRKLALDFEEGLVSSISLNGVLLPSVERDHDRFDNHHIYLKLNELQNGANRIEISFTHLFSKNGAGLYRFVDPADHLVYVYSNLEPYDAHRIFPCFDQPDLKASFELTVETPDDWIVSSNTLERDTANVDGRKSWAFPPSPLLSTYLFALHAGPYSVWKSDSNGIPLRLFARKSLAKYMDEKEWFTITKGGLEYYASLFGYPYPYSKLDQLVVPDFNIGGMENAAAIAYTERSIYRTPVTQDTRRHRADLILHEMAHQWFGDLVTMRWWNGLWLNESFATLMAAGAVDQSTTYKGAWQDFFAGMKEWAYWEDQLVTSHPIEVPVPSTDSAESIFDGITYGKGASVLKQLSYYVGDDEFRDGVQRYFQKYALRNTTLAEFIKMIGEASSIDLSGWTKSWLQGKGVNTIQAKITCTPEEKSGKLMIDKLVVIQGNSETSTELRSHKTEVGLGYLKDGKIKITESLPVTYSQAETTVSGTKKLKCPDFIFPNHKDYDFVKVELDAKSLEVATQKLSQFEDPFLRQMLWHTLWEMVIDGKLKAQDYADTVLKNISAEKDTQIVSSVLNTLISPQMGESSTVKFMAFEMRRDYQNKAEEFMRKKLQSAPAGGDLQLILFNHFLEAAQTQHSIDYMRALYSGKAKLSGFTVDQERRWSLVKHLARTGASDAKELIAAELKIDPTDNGNRSALAAEASIPTEESKKKILAQIMRTPESGEAIPIGKLREAIRNYDLLNQEDQIRASVEPYFNSVANITAFSKGDEEYARRFVGGMYPALCDPAIVQRTTQLLASHGDLPATIAKILKVNKQSDERCIRARALSAIK